MLQCNCAQYCSQYYKLHNIMTFIITSSSLVDCVSDLQGFWCCAAGIVRGYVTYSRLPSLKIQIVLYLGSLSNEGITIVRHETTWLLVLVAGDPQHKKGLLCHLPA